MPHATSLCEKMEDFIALHKAQLVNSCIPERYWESLFNKMKKEVFDAGDVFAIMKVEEAYSDIEDEDGGGGTANNEEPEAFFWQVVVTNKGGVRADDPQNIFLIDHAWTYRFDKARAQLETTPNLLPRMASLMDLSVEGKDKDQLIDEVLDEMWRFNQTYSIDNADVNLEKRRPIWYVLDEFGSRIQHSDEPTVRAVPFYYAPDQVTYTVMWPLKDMHVGDEVTRNFVENANVNGLVRKIMLLPWQPDDMTHLSYEQSEKDESFFLKFRVHESLPCPDQEMPVLPRDRCVTVYTDVAEVQQYLRDPRFELVDRFEDADIIWTSKYLTDFRVFSEETPTKLINQFPYEMVVTVTDLFSMVARRAGGRVDAQTLEAAPAWFQTTYNLHEELPQFVSYFQHRENKELPNYWICKPNNLGRSLEMHVTNNLNYILRLPDTGPVVASRYVEDPVLFDYEESGMIKFDMRYMVLLHSVSPLKISIHRRFNVRFADKPFSLDNFDDYQKHFTVNSYDADVKGKEMDCEDFVDQFQDQYPANTWNVIEESIFSAIRELFMAATAEPPPKGIAPSPQSRAMYGVDVMLKWVTDNTGDKQVQPVLLGVTFGPDGRRFCQCRSDFMNDIFGALFLDDFMSGSVMLL